MKETNFLYRLLDNGFLVVCVAVLLAIPTVAAAWTQHSYIPWLVWTGIIVICCVVAGLTSSASWAGDDNDY